MRFLAVALGGALGVALLAGCPVSNEVIFDVHTDLEPGIEFDAVVVSASDMEARDPARAQDYRDGVRLPSLSLPTGEHTFRVALRDGAETVLERNIVLRVEGRIVIPIWLVYACRSRSCPGAGDAADAVECEGGRCVSPRCSPQNPELCPVEPACRVDADCDAPVSACGANACQQGNCVFVPEAASCTSLEACVAANGCVPLPSETDAGTTMPDAPDAPPMLPDAGLPCPDDGMRSCDGDRVVACAGGGTRYDEVEVCIGGCATSPSVHCATLSPSNIAASFDGIAPLEAHVVVGVDEYVDTTDCSLHDPLSSIDTGVIVAQDGGGPSVCVLRFASLTVPSGTVLRARGSMPLILVSDADLVLQGTVDASSIDGMGWRGPGSGTGGTAGALGPTLDGNRRGGGGGGGFRGAGGAGGSSGVPAAGGAATPSSTPLRPLAGGADGGPGGGGRGGFGGGAVQLVSLRRLVFSGTVLAGGGGATGGAPGGSFESGGSGAGSGGGILLEALAIDVTAGLVAVSGGGGGAGACDPVGGARGGEGTGEPPGAGALSDCGASGGSGGALEGTSGGFGTTDGGGGGGGSGFVVVRTASGAWDAASVTQIPRGVAIVETADLL